MCDKTGTPFAFTSLCTHDILRDCPDWSTDVELFHSSPLISSHGLGWPRYWFSDTFANCVERWYLIPRVGLNPRPWDFRSLALHNNQSATLSIQVIKTKQVFSLRTSERSERVRIFCYRAREKRNKEETWYAWPKNYFSAFQPRFHFSFRRRVQLPLLRFSRLTVVVADCLLFSNSKQKNTGFHYRAKVQLTLVETGL